MDAQPHRVLVIDADGLAARSIASYLRLAGFDVESESNGERALERMHAAAAGADARPFAAAVIDMLISPMSGLELIRAMREAGIEAVPVAITGYGSIEAAVETVRLGAVDYLLKPVVEEELRIAVEKAVSRHVLVAENARLRSGAGAAPGFDDIIGADARMRRIFDTIQAVAPTKTTLLMSGESGTGKSMIARAVHARSSRASGPFIELACGSIPETLLESELFGHVKGAFTGAHADKHGRFRAAHGGTIFLDEINSASPAMQLKLLRVLQERRFEPVGSTETVEVDVRIVLASNEPLETLVGRGEFRQDLYYRINVVMLQLPPLRERRNDIALLAEHLLRRKAREVGRAIVGFSDEAMDALKQYRFPGNVRELENIIERAAVLTRSTRIGPDDLPAEVAGSSRTFDGGQWGGQWGGERGGGGDWSPMPLAEALKGPEKQIILAALNANGWNRTKTADVLQINRSTLYKKMKQYDLDREYGQTG